MKIELKNEIKKRIIDLCGYVEKEMEQINNMVQGLQENSIKLQEVKQNE